MNNRIQSLRQKEVINVRDGTRLGYVCDVEVDVKCGRIVQLIVPGPAKFFGVFGCDKEYCIDWCDIKCIGEDIILIDVCLVDILKKCEVC